VCGRKEGREKVKKGKNVVVMNKKNRYTKRERGIHEVINKVERRNDGKKTQK
jgi:hypothetical protein